MFNKTLVMNVRRERKGAFGPPLLCSAYMLLSFLIFNVILASLHETKRIKYSMIIIVSREILAFDLGQDNIEN